MKTFCKRCKETKPLFAFFIYSNGMNSGVCLSCYGMAEEEKVSFEKESLLDAKKKVEEKKSRKPRKPRTPSQKEATDRWRQSPLGRFNSYKKRAGLRGRKFTLSEEQFFLLLDSSCVYCGGSEKMGVDRIDSSIGYLFDNCAPCCGCCNWMKREYSVDFFLSHIKKIASYNKG